MTGEWAPFRETTMREIVKRREMVSAAPARRDGIGR